MSFEIQGGCFSYPKGPELFHNIGLVVEQGEILSVLGANGVGKTTLLKCMLGFQPWSAGRSLLEGQDIRTLPPRVLWQSVAYVPQAKSMAFSFTGLEMAVFGRSAYLHQFGQPRKRDIEIAEEAMETLGISHLRDKLCGQMSGGELQMVLMARALTAQPRLMVLDEPESGLDFRNQLVILELIRKLSREKALSVILNTHYPSNALRISHRTLLLTREGGHFFGDTRAVLNEENMRIAFGVNVHINTLEAGGQVYQDVLPLSLAESANRSDTEVHQ